MRRFYAVVVHIYNYPFDDDFSVSHFINELLNYAIGANAADIHFESGGRDFNIRYRRDGHFYDFPDLPMGIGQKVLAHLKALASLDVAESRKPQDGRMTVGHSSFRVATVPVQFGESLVLRVLNPGSIRLKLGELGMTEKLVKGVRGIARMPHGIFIVTGPTGAGKTTTLYSVLQDVYTEKKKYLTVEDPVEYCIEGVSQVAVNNSIGLTFAKVLRAFLRHDPDMILVGEIRDLETAKIALQASLTGHLVLTTLHTNNAASAVTRLIDMGIQGPMVASCLQGVLAQRLVRVFCRGCEGEGCELCDGSGYLGRTGVFELMEVSQGIRSLIAKNASSNELESQARLEGMESLLEYGRRIVEMGKTSEEEVNKLVLEEKA